MNIRNHRPSTALLSLLVCFTLFLPASPAQQTTPFCADPGCAQTRQLLKKNCDYIVSEKSTCSHTYVGGHYMRTLVGGYEILGDRRYLDTAIAYSDYLLKKQMPNGLWGTGYGTVYLADTGSALGLFIALYKHVDHARQKAYFDAVQRYINSIQKEGMIHANGALGTGWREAKGDSVSGPILDGYTLSSALTGGEIAAAGQIDTERIEAATPASLRRQLGPPGIPHGGVLVTDYAAVQLNPRAIRTDVAAFEAALKEEKGTGESARRMAGLRRATELYRGELLPAALGLPHSAAPLAPGAASCASLAGGAWSACRGPRSAPPPGAPGATWPTIACPPACTVTCSTRTT